MNRVKASNRNRTSIHEASTVRYFAAAAAFIILSAAAVMAAGSAPAGGEKEGVAASNDAANVLLKADADFDQAVAEKRAGAWVAAFAPDGIMFRGGEVVQGPAAILELMGPSFADTSFSLRWTPVHADIAASGDLGYTYGTYESKSPGADGKPVVRTGMYVTIWKKQPDGSWKVVVDLGSANPRPVSKPGN